MKVCNKCGVPKPETEFSRHGVSRPGLSRRDCKKCASASSKARRNRDREAANLISRRWYQRNKDKVKAQRLIRPQNPEKTAEIARKSKYGVTPEDWTRLLSEQKGCCALCSLPKPLCVDHDHLSGKVRGLLCQTCNRALGMIKDCVTTAQAAVEYLKKHS